MDKEKQKELQRIELFKRRLLGDLSNMLYLAFEHVRHHYPKQTIEEMESVPASSSEPKYRKALYEMYCVAYDGIEGLFGDVVDGQDRPSERMKGGEE